MENNPGVRLARVGETWRRLFSKCVLQVTGQEANVACGTDQLEVGVEAFIEGGIHDMRLLWEHHYQEEDWWFPCVGAQDKFNEENQTEML